MKMQLYRWIIDNNRTNDEGIRLYKELKLQESIPPFGVDEFLFVRLREAYNKLLETPSTKPKPKPTTAPAPKLTAPPKKHTAPVVKKKLATDTALVDKVKDEATLLYKNFMNERALLFKDISPTPKVGENESLNLLKRRKAVNDLMKLHDQMHRKYEDVQFVKEYNRLPAKEEEVIIDFIDEVDIYKQIANARKYISKYRMKEKREGLTPTQYERLTARELLLEKLLIKYNQIKHES